MTVIIIISVHLQFLFPRIHAFKKVNVARCGATQLGIPAIWEGGKQVPGQLRQLSKNPAHGGTGGLGIQLIGTLSQGSIPSSSTKNVSECSNPPKVVINLYI